MARLPGRRASGRFGSLPHIIEIVDQRPRGKPGPPGGARPRPAVSRATYWRRRAVVFVLGIGLLSGLGWTLDGLLTASSSAGQAGPPASPGTADPTPARVASHRASPTPSPSARPKPTPARHRSTRHLRAAGRAAACAPGAVTLRLSSPQYWYQAGKTPLFTVRAVAAAASRPCRFNMGAKFVAVTAAGAGGPIWSSADCPSGSGSHVVVLTAGRPGVLQVSWDRRTSSAGCRAIRRPVRPGEYKVTAVSGRLRSSTVNIVLGARGASGP